MPLPRSLLAVLSLLAGAVSAQTTAPRTDERGTGEATAKPAQAPMPDDLAALARRLAAAHGLGEDEADIRSFRAELTVEPRDEKKQISIDVLVDFAAPSSLRCQVTEQGTRVERGFDPKIGPWAVVDGETVRLEGPEYTRDAEKVAKDLSLCRQMLRFLRPTRLLAGLRDPAPVRQADLAIHRLRFTGCTVAEGTIDRLPTFAHGEVRARVRLFLDPKSDQLLAVEAQPLDEDDKPDGIAELVLLDAYDAARGVRLPTKVTVYRLAGPGPEPVTTVHVRAIDPRREFPASHFAAPK